MLQNCGAKIQTGPHDMDRSPVLQLWFLIICPIVLELVIDANQQSSKFWYIEVTFFLEFTQKLNRFASNDMCDAVPVPSLWVSDAVPIKFGL